MITSRSRTVTRLTRSSCARPACVRRRRPPPARAARSRPRAPPPSATALAPDRRSLPPRAVCMDETFGCTRDCTTAAATRPTAAPSSTTRAPRAVVGVGAGHQGHGLQRLPRRGRELEQADRVAWLGRLHPRQPGRLHPRHRGRVRRLPRRLRRGTLPAPRTYPHRHRSPFPPPHPARAARLARAAPAA